MPRTDVPEPRSDPSHPGIPRPGRLQGLLRPPGTLLSRLRRLDLLARRGMAPVVYGNRVDVLEGGETAYAAMLDAIRGAERSVAVEMYTWADDRLGRRFAEAVAARARERVPALVLVDAFGSLGSSGLVAALESAGVKVRWVHPLAPWAPKWYPNRRDHRKLVIVDGAVGFAGGLNLAEAYTREFSGDEAWRDLAIRVEGPAAREMTRLFLETWLRAGGEAEDAAPLGGMPRDRGAAGVQVVAGEGVRGRRSLRRYYLSLLALAREHVFLVSAYFVPELSLRRALCRAARRGVRVDLLLPGRSDVPVVRWAGRASYGRMLEAGVRIRETRGPVLHAKVAVFDGRALLAGSANLDHRSFRHNLEVAVNVFDAGASARALAAFEREFASAEPVTLDTWRRRSLVQRLQERVAALVRYWL